MPFRHYATFCVFVALGISACQRPTYRYFHPTSSPALFANAGEVQLSGDLGSSGYSAKPQWPCQPISASLACTTAIILFTA